MRQTDELPQCVNKPSGVMIINVELLELQFKPSLWLKKICLQEFSKFPQTIDRKLKLE